jgi:hypothetical protein
VKEDTSMKKLTVLSAVLTLFFSAVPLMGADYIIGAKGGYFVWRPFLCDIPGGGFSTLESGTGALAGPVLGIAFTEDITLSVSGLFGQQTAQWNMGNTFNEKYGEYESTTSYMQEQRYDIDTALSYQIIPGMRIFIGYKYQFLEVEWISSERQAGNATSMSVAEDEVVFKIPLQGIAIGGSYTAPISDLYFFSMTLSGIFMRGKFKYSSHEIKYRTYESTAITGTPNDESATYDMQQIGLNFEPAIGIRTGGPIITLGLRYQLLRAQFYNQEASNDGPSDNWMNDHLYGVFMSVMFVL